MSFVYSATKWQSTVGLNRNIVFLISFWDTSCRIHVLLIYSCKLFASKLLDHYSVFFSCFSFVSIAHASLSYHHDSQHKQNPALLAPTLQFLHYFGGHNRTPVFNAAEFFKVALEPLWPPPVYWRVIFLSLRRCQRLNPSFRITNTLAWCRREGQRCSQRQEGRRVYIGTRAPRCRLVPWPHWEAWILLPLIASRSIETRRRHREVDPFSFRNTKVNKHEEWTALITAIKLEDRFTFYGRDPARLCWRLI